MHDLDLKLSLNQAGFNGEDLFETGVVSYIDESIFGKREAGDAGEDFGRAPVWNAFGLWKKEA